MANSKEAGMLAEQVVQGTVASPTTSATPAGPTDPEERQRLVEAINQVFALFRLNFHNQFYSAYPDAEQLTLIKRLWLEALSDYPPESILRGAKHAIEKSEYLPTLNRMLECCQQGLKEQGLPTTRDAFLEACEKPSPKAEQHWSHAIVYYAGRDSDWFFLANNPERLTWPEFKRHYEGYLLRVNRGEQFALPAQPELPQPEQHPMSAQERQAELAKLRSELGL